MATYKTARKNFTVQKRADFPLQLRFKDSAGTVTDLTGYTVAASVYNNDRSTLFANFSVTYTDRTNGLVDLKLSDTDTENFSLAILDYDIKLTDPNGDKFYPLEGKLFISEGYTA